MQDSWKYYSKKSNTSFLTLKHNNYYFVIFNFDELNVNSDEAINLIEINQQYLDSLESTRIDVEKLKEATIILKYQNDIQGVRKNTSEIIKFIFENENQFPRDYHMILPIFRQD